MGICDRILGWLGAKGRGTGPTGESAFPDWSGPTLVVDETGIARRRHDGSPERIRWETLVAVEILTTDEGPWNEDVWWLLSGEEGTGCCLPNSVVGDCGLLARLGELPGFDHTAVIQAMGSTEWARFPCWRRPDRAAAA